MKHPELFDALDIAQPKGVLLYGLPGTGKTLLSCAVAHHTDCKFIRVSGSELMQKYVGEGSRMVRELFVMAREHAPSIIFMDEIDSIRSSRGESGNGGGDSEVQRTMLELLNQLDGFEPTKNIKVIMATNRIGRPYFSHGCPFFARLMDVCYQISWILHFYDSVALIEKLSSLLQVLKLVFRIYVSTLER